MAGVVLNAGETMKGKSSCLEGMKVWLERGKTQCASQPKTSIQSRLSTSSVPAQGRKDQVVQDTRKAFMHAEQK
jgi:hypothetical protein